MDVLPAELMTMILEQLMISGHKSVRELRLVNRALAPLATPLLFQSVSVWISSESLQRLTNMSLLHLATGEAMGMCIVEGLFQRCRSTRLPIRWSLRIVVIVKRLSALHQANLVRPLQTVLGHMIAHPGLRIRG